MTFLAAIMKTVFVLSFCLSSLFGISAGAGRIQLVAKPQEIIPGLDPTLEISCSPGSVNFRQIFLIQLLSKQGQNNVPVATLLPGQSPSLVSSDPRMTVSGQLDNAAPASARLTLSVDRPMPIDAGSIACDITGLDANGNEITSAANLVITVHPESNNVDALLKEMVADLKREADAMWKQTLALQAENQRLSQLAAAKQKALTDKRSELQQLRSQFQTLQQEVENKEVTLNQTAEELVEEIANVTRDAPPMRVSFNAVEKTERTYTSGTQIKFESLEMNDGDGYNTSTSVFQAPVAGVYFLTTAQLAHDSASAAYRVYSIRKNSTVVGASYNGDDRQSSTFSHSSTGTIVSLTPYDLIRVYEQYASSSTTHLTPYSNTPDGLSTNFAGYLMY